MSKILAVALFGIALVAAQPLTAFLNGAQIDGNNQVASIGSGLVQLSENPNTLTATVAWQSSLTGATAVHIHGPGMPGVNAGVLLTLNIDRTTNTSASITALESQNPQVNISALYNGEYYFVVHTLALPNGAIRGQIYPFAGPWFSSILNGDSIPSNSPALGKGYCTITEALSLSCMLNYYNLADATDAHVHGPAFPGSNAGVVLTLIKSGNTFSGSMTLTAAQANLLGLGQMYFVVHSASLPGGAIRGQLYPTTVDPMALNGVYTSPCTMVGTNEYETGCINFVNGNGNLVSQTFSDAACTTRDTMVNFPNLLFSPYMQAATKGGWDNAFSQPLVMGNLTFFGASASANIAGIQAACPSAVVTGNSIVIQQSTCSAFWAMSFPPEYGNVMFNPTGPALSLTNFDSNMQTGLNNFVIESTYTRNTGLTSCFSNANPTPVSSSGMPNPGSSSGMPNPVSSTGNGASTVAPVVSLVATLVVAVRLF